MITTEGEDAPFTDPVITTVLFGPGTVASPAVALDLCGDEWSNTSVQAQGKADESASGAVVSSEAAQMSAAYFSVTIPAGESRYLAFFNAASEVQSLAAASEPPAGDPHPHLHRLIRRDPASSGSPGYGAVGGAG